MIWGQRRDKFDVTRQLLSGEDKVFYSGNSQSGFQDEAQLRILA